MVCIVVDGLQIELGRWDAGMQAHEKVAAAHAQSALGATSMMLLARDGTAAVVSDVSRPHPGAVRGVRIALGRGGMGQWIVTPMSCTGRATSCHTRPPASRSNQRSIVTAAGLMLAVSMLHYSSRKIHNIAPVHCSLHCPSTVPPLSLHCSSTLHHHLTTQRASKPSLPCCPAVLPCRCHFLLPSSCPCCCWPITHFGHLVR